jgi:hypothetical protein
VQFVGKYCELVILNLIHRHAGRNVFVGVFLNFISFLFTIFHFDSDDVIQLCSVSVCPDPRRMFSKNVAVETAYKHAFIQRW